MATLYFYNSPGPSSLSTLSNWWQNSAHNTAALALPISTDTAIIETPVNAGICNAGTSVITSGASITGGQFNGDVRLMRTIDWKVGVRFYRMAIGPNGSFIGPVLYRLDPHVDWTPGQLKPFRFQDGPWQKSLTTNQSYSYLEDHFCAPDEPGQNAIVEIKTSNLQFEVLERKYQVHTKFK